MAEAKDNPQAEVPEKPWIVRRAEVPVSTASAEVEAEVRQLLAHPSLGLALAGAAASVSWIEVGYGRELTPRFHETPSLLVVVHGKALLTGGAPAGIEAGDVVTIPAKEAYGIAGVAQQGLRAMHVILAEVQRETAPEPYSLERLLERNLLRCSAILETPYFRMLRDGGLDAKTRDRFLQCSRVFSDAFQVFLLTRQAMCREDSFQAVFGEHLEEEFGHNEMLPARQLKITADPILKATSSWFCQQMLVLDNAGKLVVNLALETAAYHVFNLGRRLFRGSAGEGYFDTHAEADEHHKDMGVELLDGLHPDTYEQLYGVLEDSYDMIEAVTHRIFELATADEMDGLGVTPRASEIREIMPVQPEKQRSHG
ncbi:MAG TPA: hypothetical protein VM686_08875 [Polyangiaceae bacterium]|nr:hypothetical protein [Polyangiaceae bacterium]